MKATLWSLIHFFFLVPHVLIKSSHANAFQMSPTNPEIFNENKQLLGETGFAILTGLFIKCRSAVGKQRELMLRKESPPVFKLSPK